MALLCSIYIFCHLAGLNETARHRMVNETSTNSTHVIEESKLMSDEWIAVLCLIYVLIFIIGCVTNAGVIYLIASKTKKIAYDLMIICLAASDLLASIFTPLQMIPDVISRFVKWYYGYLGCKIIPIFAPATTFLSCWILVAIAVDRYRYA